MVGDTAATPAGLIWKSGRAFDQVGVYCRATSGNGGKKTVRTDFVTQADGREAHSCEAMLRPRKSPLPFT